MSVDVGALFIDASLTITRVLSRADCWKQKMLIDVKKKRNEQTEKAELPMGAHT
jgi:hypothetical protein